MGNSESKTQILQKTMTNLSWDSYHLQLKIKSQIKDDFDLDVKQVNIKIDSVEEKENEKKESKKIVEKNETIIESQKAEKISY